MKFGQILVCCMINISNMFLAQSWRPDNSSRPFYFNKMTTQQDMTTFNSWQLPFLNVQYSPFQKPQSSKLFKRFLKINVLVYIYQLVMFVYLMSCGYIHHDMGLVNQEMVENTKTWISGEQNITFIKIKNSQLVPQMTHFEELSFCSRDNL